MRKIPEEMRNEMSQDPYYTKCCLEGIVEGCGGRIEWHHNLIYAGKQRNHPWCILPVCHDHHMQADSKLIKPTLNKIMISRATPEDLLEYPKRNFV